MGKHPIDRDRPRDAKVAKEYARVERAQADPATSSKVKAMAKASRQDDTSSETREFARIEREQGEPTSDPRVKAMTRAAHRDEDKSLVTRLKQFLNIDRQHPES